MYATKLSSVRSLSLLCFLTIVSAMRILDAINGNTNRQNRSQNATERAFVKRTVRTFNKRMPLYMMSLYKKLTSRKTGIPHSANTIRGLPSVTTIESESSMKIEFNLEIVKDSWTVTRDEIHLYMTPGDGNDKTRFKPYTLKFIDIHSGKLVRKFIVPAFNRGWQVLSLNKWTNKWVKNHSSNEGLLVEIYRKGKPAKTNPFTNFPNGNSPYMILYASEHSTTLLAWRFLIENSLNSATSNAKNRRVRKASRQTVANTDTSSRSDPNPKLLCKVNEKNVQLKNMKISERLVVVKPTKFKMKQCADVCLPTAMTHLLGNSHSIAAQTPTKRCCNATQFQDVMVLLNDTKNNEMDVHLLKKFAPKTCQWLLQ